MTRDDIIHMAQASGLHTSYGTDSIERFAAVVAATECEKVAWWMIRNGYATGHGDKIEDLLDELEWQIAERK